MRLINVTNSMEDYFDLNHVIRSEKPGGNDITTNVALRTFFGRVVRGQSQVFTAPFAKGDSTETILDDWDKVLKSIATKWPSLYEFENDLRSKVGPMSVAKPLSERKQDIRDYYECVKLKSTPLQPWAVWDVMHEWQRAVGIRVKDEGNVLLEMKTSTNSGSPFFEKRRNVLKETGTNIGLGVVGDAVSMALNDWEGLTCAVIGWRGQEGGIKIDDVKQRLVWMFPFGVNILELAVYQPLIQAAQNLNLAPSWVSMDAVDARITKLFDSKSDSQLIVCTDFEKFDQHFNVSLQNAAEEILDYLVASDNHKSFWFKNVYPVKYMIPLMYNYGRLVTGRHGMASGSGGTNADETLAHRALQFEAAGARGAELNPNSMCLGDDGVLTYPGITAEDVMNVYKSHGLSMNSDKQHVSENDCIYLRRWHHQDYRIDGVCAGVYSTFRALGRLRYMERWMDPKVWNQESVALRQLSILENCKYHPLRDEFVEFCMKRDKYRLGKDIPGFLENVSSIAKKYVELIPGFLGYTKSLQTRSLDELCDGMSSWWIVNYLKSV